MEASTIDLYNASKKVMSGGSFLGGIHTAAAGGVWLVIINGFAGFKVNSKGASFNPALPEFWDSLGFNLVVNGCLISVKITKSNIVVQSHNSNQKEIGIELSEGLRHLKPGEAYQASAGSA